MFAVGDIPIRVETSGEPQDWGNALPVLHEIRHALERLAETGETTLIDLNGIPFGPGDEARLLALLGEGEVEATLHAFGPTRIRETAVPGVWLVDHRNAEDERLVLHLEVAAVPNILLTQEEDLAGAVAVLDSRMDAGLTKPITRPDS